MEKPAYQSTRIWKRTLAGLRLLRALTGKPGIEIMDNLVAAELVRLQGTRLLAAAPGRKASTGPAQRKR